MTLNHDGFCSRCMKWALDFPGLACPWCKSVSADEARKGLGLDPDASPVDVINAIREELDVVRQWQRQLMALRSKAARALLKRGNVVEDVKAARTRVWAVERWAVADQPEATRQRLAPRQTKTKRGMRVEYEESMARREEIFQIAADDDVPERLRPPLGTRD